MYLYQTPTQTLHTSVSEPCKQLITQKKGQKLTRINILTYTRRNEKHLTLKIAMHFTAEVKKNNSSYFSEMNRKAKICL